MCEHKRIQRAKLWVKDREVLNLLQVIYYSNLNYRTPRFLFVYYLAIIVDIKIIRIIHGYIYLIV